MSGEVCRRRAGDGEAHGGGHGGQVQIGPEATGPAEHDIGLARALASCRVGIQGSDDHVRAPVAVQVAGGGDRPARMIACIHARDGEAVGTGQGAEVEAGTEATQPAEHDIGFTGIGPPARVALRGTDDQIVNAVAVDVPGRSD